MREETILMAGAVPCRSVDGDAIIARALAAARDHLDMAAAYVSEFDGDEIVLRHVDKAEGAPDIRAGDRHPVVEVYCRHIHLGSLPQFIPDTAALPLCQTLRVTTALPIGSHAGVPLVRPDGSVYGMFCCFSTDPHPTLNARDLKVLRFFAARAQEQLTHDLRRRSHLDETAARVDAMLRSRDFHVVYQPIYHLGDGRLASLEALCRFRPEPYRPPDRWFEDARLAGMQTELEVAVIEEALRTVGRLPPGVRLSVNASSDTAASSALLDVFERSGAERIVLEITEHDRSAEPCVLLQGTRALRAAGALIAIDDVGAGYSGLHQILRLQPDILKLDMGLVRDIHCDPARRALAAAMVSFAAGTGARVTAEGIERREELDVLRALGIDHGQGWLLGRPGPFAAAAPVAAIEAEPPARAQEPRRAAAGRRA